MSKSISVVLAHGAWADGSSWGKVIAGLARRRVDAVAAPLPLTSLADDVAALERSLDRAGGPVVLVGHAYAGGVIGATRHPAVKALAYVAAMAPDEGEVIAAPYQYNPAHPLAPRLEPDANGLVWLSREAFATAFAQNASAEEQTVLHAVQRPISVSCITAPVGPPLWRDVPAWYLVAKQDRMIVEPTQRLMAERMKAHIHEHDVDHAPSVTAPEVVVELILQALHGASA